MPSFNAPGAFGQTPSAGFGKPQGAANSWGDVKPFLIRFGIGWGILMGVLAALLGLGFVSEVLALVALGIGFLITLALAFTGRIWMIVIAFQETALQGLLVLLVPYYWLFYLAMNRKKCWRPVAVLVSSLAPALLLLLMGTLFAERYDGGARRSHRFRTTTNNNNRFRTNSIQPLVKDRVIPPVQVPSESNVLRTVSFRVAGVSNRVDPEAKADQLLREMPGYVAGSFRLSEDQKTATLQYRGQKSRAMQYALRAGMTSGIMMSVSPTFEEDAPNEDTPVPPDE